MSKPTIEELKKILAALATGFGSPQWYGDRRIIEDALTELGELREERIQLKIIESATITKSKNIFDLRAKLEKAKEYIKHHPECHIYSNRFPDKTPCSCGFERTLKSLEEG